MMEKINLSAANVKNAKKNIKRNIDLQKPFTVVLQGRKAQSIIRKINTSSLKEDFVTAKGALLDSDSDLKFYIVAAIGLITMVTSLEGYRLFVKTNIDNSEEVIIIFKREK